MNCQKEEERPSGHEIYEGCLSGAQDRPFLPCLRSDSYAFHRLPRSLVEFHEQEGHDLRDRRLRALWKRLVQHSRGRVPLEEDELVPEREREPCGAESTLTHESAETLFKMYEEELRKKCVDKTGHRTRSISWGDFKKYADRKEAELWKIFHDELDLDGNGRLDAEELDLALKKAGIHLGPAALSEFMGFLSRSPHPNSISFPDFRDFLLPLARPATMVEIYRYYEVRKYTGEDGRGGAARVTMEGDVSISGEDRPPKRSIKPISDYSRLNVDDEPLDLADDFYGDEDFCEVVIEEESHLGTSLKYLLAGGIAGVVSRTTTAPLDRLKVFLITRTPVVKASMSDVEHSVQISVHGLRAIKSAIARIYAEGGILAFWVGNALSVTKIFPESAIKFFSYETSKRLFAIYVDKVDDPREISASSRFISGGVGGITSQLSIYPIETLKTQMMSTAGVQKRDAISVAKRLWKLGGLRAFYRGLPVGLVGVFPYAAIDMSTFEALKLSYLRSTGKEEPGVLPILVFGSISGGVGATSVYPLNLVRTRLQASGSSGHPERYTSIYDVAWKTYMREGWKGFYRGSIPTLAKIIPSVSISYVIYEQTKKRLGV